MATLVASVVASALVILLVLPLFEKGSERVGGRLGRVWLRMKGRPPAAVGDAPADSYPQTETLTSILVSEAASIPDPAVVVYGAGILGEDFYRRSQEQAFFSFREEQLLRADVLWCIDDDVSKKNGRIGEAVVRGTLGDLTELLRQQKGQGPQVGALVIAIAELDQARIRQAIDICRAFDIPCYRFGYGFRRLDR